MGKVIFVLTPLATQVINPNCSAFSSVFQNLCWAKDSEGLSEAERDLKNLKEELSEDFPVGPLIKKCCTLDQVLTNDINSAVPSFVFAYMVVIYNSAEV